MDQVEKPMTAEQADQHMEQLSKQQELDEGAQDGTEVKENNYQIFDTEEEINFELSNQELASNAITLSELFQVKKGKELEFDRVKKQWKSEIGDLEAEIESIYKKIEDGEDRFVQCKKKVHFGERMVYFLDTEGNVLHEREMTEEDKQMNLDVAVEPESFVSEQDSMDAGSGATELDQTLDNAFDKIEKAAQDQSPLDGQEELENNAGQDLNNKVDF